MCIPSVHPMSGLLEFPCLIVRIVQAMSCHRLCDNFFVSWRHGPSGPVLCVLPHRPDSILCCTGHATSSMQLRLHSRVPPIYTVAVNRCRPGGGSGGERAVGRFLRPVQRAHKELRTPSAVGSAKKPLAKRREKRVVWDTRVCDAVWNEVSEPVWEAVQTAAAA